MTVHDVEFSATVGKKGGRFPRRIVRALIYAQAVVALLTASWDFVYSARARGLIGWDDLRPYDRALETVSVLAFLLSLVFPVLIVCVVWRAEPADRGRWWAILSTLGLLVFQLMAILPMVQ